MTKTHLLKDYCLDTSIHGCRYFVTGRNFIERISWALIVIAGFSYAAYIINASFSDWKEHPVETTIDSISHSIKDIVHPAVTICPDVGLARLKLYLWFYLS